MNPCDEGNDSNVYCLTVNFCFSLCPMCISVFSLMWLSGNEFFDTRGRHACQLRFLLSVQATLKKRASKEACKDWYV